MDAFGDGESYAVWVELKRVVVSVGKERGADKARTDVVAARLRIGMRKVNLRALDAAYSIAFPNCTPINVNKAKRK